LFSDSLWFVCHMTFLKEGQCIGGVTGRDTLLHWPVETLHDVGNIRT
jgi:hypothetical protein